jgi:hypothetical protein
MSWVWTGNAYTYSFNATCININDLENVVKITFITQLIGMLLTIISTGMVCTVYWQPFCCRKRNSITPDEFAEIYTEFIQTYRAPEINQRV